MRPPALHTSQHTVGIVSPASAVKDLHTLQAGIKYLESLGLRVVTRRAPVKTSHYLAGTDQERADELNSFLRDPDIPAVFCARGGYGSLRILQQLDYEAVRTSPTLIIGYSDITALHLAIYAQTKVPGISGPMVSTEWAHSHPESEQLFWDLAKGGTPTPLLSPEGTQLEGLRTGQATGTLIGGNLAVLTRLIGTPYLPDLTGAILFIEDVGEAAYRIDAMLAHLRLAGIWDQLGGLVLGEFTESGESNRTSNDIMGVFEDYCQSVSFPVAKGLMYGHIPKKNAMPVGVEARLTVEDSHAALYITEPVVSINR